MLTALFSVGSASAATQGVGTSQAVTSLVQLDLGDLLSANVLSDASRSTLDTAVSSVPEAATALAPLTLTSGAVPALNQSIAPTEVRTTGAEKKTDYSADLGSVLPQLVDGTLTPATLSAIVDAAGARAGLLSNLAGLSLGGGLATVDAVAADLAATATKDASLSNRSLSVDSISGLNLGALLNGLGIPVSSLDLATVEALAEDLGLLGSGGPVHGALVSLGVPTVPTDAAALDGIITTLDGNLDDATAALGALNAAFPGAACTDLVTLVDPLATTVGLPVGTTCTAALATLTANQTAAAIDLGGLLSMLLSTLDGIELLNIDGIDAGVASKATDAVDTSTAKVTATVGTINVANLADIPGTDVLAAVTTVESQLNDILDAVDPGLLDLIDLELLDTSGTGVTKNAAGYVKSTANLTALDLSINPPANLTALVAGLGLDPATGIGGVLTAIPGFGTLPALPGVAAADVLGGVLGGAGPAVDALAGGARLRIASVSAVADFLPAAAGAPAGTGGTLPRTGGDSGITAFAVVAVLMALLGLGVRRRVLAPVRVD